jgi:hypothetical protein
LCKLAKSLNLNTLIGYIKNRKRHGKDC